MKIDENPMWILCVTVVHEYSLVFVLNDKERISSESGPSKIIGNQTGKFMFVIASTKYSFFFYFGWTTL